jgi:hypothetical protein
MSMLSEDDLRFLAGLKFATDGSPIIDGLCEERLAKLQRLAHELSAR